MRVGKAVLAGNVSMYTQELWLPRRRIVVVRDGKEMVDLEKRLAEAACVAPWSCHEGAGCQDLLCVRVCVACQNSA